MSARYVFTASIWPTIVAAVTLAGLAVYAWRRRSVSGALPFAMMTALALPWATGAALELTAVDVLDEVFWVKFQRIWQLPTVTAGLWFALDYTNLNRWLTRTALGLLALPPVAFLTLALTNDTHQLLWRGFTFDGDVRLVTGPASWLFINYGVVLALATTLAFVWLFFQSPLHRRPAALCLCGHVATRGAFLLDLANLNPVAPLDPTMIAGSFASVMYAIALFRFRLFDLVPVAYRTVVDRIRDGILVVDSQQRIVDLNPAAERILGMTGRQARGIDVARVLPTFADRDVPVEGGMTAPQEISLGTGAAARHYAVDCSPLIDRRRFARGDLVVLRDITREKDAQARVLDQQRALATLRERARVARELHDSLGQVLGFLKLQAQAARRLLACDRPNDADAYLAKLIAAAQDAHVDVREFIVGAEAGGSGRAFLSSLEQCLQQFRATTGIATTLDAPEDFGRQPFDAMVNTQLLAILQEAMTNARKHAGASKVHIRLGTVDGQAEAVVEDDGAGFDPAMLERAPAERFGLRFMRQRAQEVGGSVHIQSMPGKGTKVIIHVPRRKELS